jgi:pyruvate dehydrogenase complex dehydrogenase (E1) component
VNVKFHDVEALCKAFHDGSTVTGRPTCLVAKTFKGKGIPGEWNLTFTNISPVVMAILD